MIIMKFGGTSVENAAAMDTVIHVVTDQRKRHPLVVLSAIAGATNTLLQSAHHAHEGRLDAATSSLNGLFERHVVLLENLIEKRSTIQMLILDIRKRFDELKTLCQGIAILGELTNRSLDAIASVGEELSTMIFSKAMTEKGFPAELVDARTWMITDDQFAGATPLIDRINEETKNRILPLIE